MTPHPPPLSLCCFLEVFYHIKLIHVFLLLEKKILIYLKQNIRAPSLHQVLKWAKPLGVTNSDARIISDRAPFRHSMGQFE